MSTSALLAASLAVIPLAVVACGDDLAAPSFDAAPRPDSATADAGAPDAGSDAAPGPVTSFVAEPGALGLSLTWANPSDADLDGVVIIVSTVGEVTFVPLSGTTYTAGETVAPDEVVIFASSGTIASLPGPVPGADYHFAAFAYDTAVQYSPVARTTGRDNRLGAQTATLSIDLTNEVVTITQPDDLTLTATATYTDASDSLSIDLGVENDTARLLFNLTALSTAINQGAQAGSRFPLVGGEPSTYFGPDALDVGAVATRTIDLSGIDGAVSPITIDLSFVDAPMLYGSNYGGDWTAVDTSGSGESLAVTFAAGVAQQLRQGRITADGKFVYAGEKQTPFVNVIDTRTNTAVGSTDLSTAGLGSVGGLDLAPNGHVYAVLNDNAHFHASDANRGGRGSAATEVALVHLDASLTEVARLTLSTVGSHGGTGVYISPDGARAMVLVADYSGAASQVWVIDLATFAVLDVNAGVVGDDPVVLSATGFAEHAVFSEDGSRFFVAFNGRKFGGDVAGIDMVDTATYAVTAVPLPGIGNAAGPMIAAGTRVYLATRQGALDALAYDYVAGTQTVLDLDSSTDATGMAAGPDGRYFAMDRARVYVFDAATDTRIDTDGDAGNGNGFITASEQLRAHMMVVSPF
ncbi:MAG: hypothetical protein R2939_07220 [Kofleriaceae bacterium]